MPSKMKKKVWIPKSGRSWTEWNENFFFALNGTDKQYQKITRKHEIKYYQLLKPYYTKLTEEEKYRADWLVVISFDTRFGRPRIDRTRLSVWDVLSHLEDENCSWEWTSYYKTPILTEKNIRDALAVWFIKRWMNSKLPLVSRRGHTQAEIAQLLPVELRPFYTQTETLNVSNGGSSAGE